MQLASFRALALQRLHARYSFDESQAIVRIWLSERLGLVPYELILSDKQQLTGNQVEGLFSDLHRLEAGEPIQYVLNAAWFDGLKLWVTPAVLIPRPETEELVEWIAQTHGKHSSIRLADIGTGSGCIALALKRRFKGWDITATDLSTEALQVARSNSVQLGLDIHLVQHDLFDRATPNFSEPFDLLICNPPYIDPSNSMDFVDERVRNYEPHSALYTPAGDHLAFYKALVDFASAYLKPHAYIYAELNPLYSFEVATLWEQLGLQKIELRLDLNGRMRMIRGSI